MGYLILHEKPLNRVRIDLANGNTTIIGNGYDFVFESPDKTKIAYLDYDADTLIIENAQGDSLIEIGFDVLSVKPEWDNLTGWLGNESVIIERGNIAWGDIIDAPAPPYLMVYNLETGDKAVFNMFDYPVDTLYWNIQRWSTRTGLLPDPSLHKLVYIGSIDDGDIPTVLIDLQSGAEIVRVHAFGGYYDGMPKWSPDGSQFVIDAPLWVKTLSGQLLRNYSNGPEEQSIQLFSVTLDGKIERLTYPAGEYGSGGRAPTWSPDGSKIAYWAAIGKDREDDYEELAVVDVASHKITNYCIPGYFSSEITGSQAPIWSSDGGALAVVIPDEVNREQKNLVIVDLVNNIAIQLIEDVFYLDSWVADSD